MVLRQYTLLMVFAGNSQIHKYNKQGKVRKESHHLLNIEQLTVNELTLQLSKYRVTLA